MVDDEVAGFPPTPLAPTAPPPPPLAPTASTLTFPKSVLSDLKKENSPREMLPSIFENTKLYEKWKNSQIKLNQTFRESPTFYTDSEFTKLRMK